MASTFMSALSTTATVLSAVLRRNKGEQTLDPIATLFMLTLRNFQAYDKAKPAVAENYFYWSIRQFKVLESAKRTAAIVGHDDLSYLEEPLTLLVTYWKPSSTSSLIKIAKLAISGLEKAHTAYEDTPNCVKTTAELYTIKLKEWIEKIKEREQVDLEKGSIDEAFSDLELQETPVQDTPFIQKIKRVWTQNKIDLFYELYVNQDLPNVKTLLGSQRELYFKELLSNDITPFIEDKT